MPGKKLKSYLDENKVKYLILTHSAAYTAQEIAEKAHISGKEVAKTVMISVKEKMAMAVLPASKNVNFDKLEAHLGTNDVLLAPEKVFQNHFPDCEPGAMPPFGNLYDMKVYVSKSLSEDEEIAFNAGNHKELIKMKFEVFHNLVEPEVVDF